MPGLYVMLRFKDSGLKINFLVRIYIFYTDLLNGYYLNTRQ